MTACNNSMPSGFRLTQGTTASSLHGASTPDVAEEQARSARSSEASLCTLGTACDAGGEAHAADARPQAPASAWGPQLRQAGAQRSRALSSGGSGSCTRVHAPQDSPPRASPSDPQAMVRPGGAGDAPTASLHSRAPHSGSNSGIGSHASGRAPSALAAKHVGPGEQGHGPLATAFGDAVGREQLGVPMSASGVLVNRTAGIPGEGNEAHGGVRRRHGPNPFYLAG